MEGEPKLRECPFCLVEIPEAARRCRYCTSMLTGDDAPDAPAGHRPSDPPAAKRDSEEELPIWKRSAWVTAIAGFVTAAIAGIGPATSAVNGCYAQSLKERELSHQSELARRDQEDRFRKDYLAMALGKNYDLEKRPPVLRFLSSQDDDGDLQRWASQELGVVETAIVKKEDREASLESAAAKARAVVADLEARIKEKQARIMALKDTEPEKQPALAELASLQAALVKARAEAEEAARRSPASLEAQCRRSQGCVLHGQCTARDGRCLATSSEDCAASQDCVQQGWCVLVNGRCGPKPDSNPVQSTVQSALPPGVRPPAAAR